MRIYLIEYYKPNAGWLMCICRASDLVDLLNQIKRERLHAKIIAEITTSSDASRAA